jgi:RimJ/RimL family protein N-acetyltransferase
MKLTVPIQTERLTLRQYTESESDFDALFAMHSDPEVTRHLLFDPRTPDEVRESLKKRAAPLELTADGDAVNVVVELRETGQHLGDLTLFLVSTEHRLAEIGFVFHPHFHGHGYASEAATALLRVAFEDLEFHRVIGRCDVRNTASSALMKRIGMRQEAHFVRNEFLKGEWTDELVFALLDEEWSARS